jgi:hypothetical protein
MKKYLNSFFVGILGAFGALMLEYVFLILFFPAADPEEGRYLLGLMITAVFLEEIIKFLLLFKITAKNDSQTIFFISIIFGAGFSLAEILANALNPETRFQNMAAFFYIALAHLATVLIYGYVLARYRNALNCFFALLLATALHLFLNLAILRQYIDHNWASVILFFVLITTTAKFLLLIRKGPALPNERL